MSWTLSAAAAGSSRPKSFPLQNDVSHVVLTTFDRGHLGVVGQLRPNLHTELGRITIGPWGAKLEAVDDTLSIHSAHFDLGTASVDPRTEKYELKPRIGERSEAIFLRHGDVISSRQTTTSLTCHWNAAEVQVSSSAADAVVASLTEVQNGVAETPEEETEDEDPKNTIIAVKSTQTISQQPQPTPQLSNQRSVVVQETPTVARFNGPAEYAITSEEVRTSSQPIENTPSPKVADQAKADGEPYSTAHTGESQEKAAKNAAKAEGELEALSDASSSASIDVSVAPAAGIFDHTSPQMSKSSPRVEIPKRPSRKRPSSIANGHESETNTDPVGRSSKRGKKTVSSEDDTQDSRMSNIVVDTSQKATPAAKSKKRLSQVAEGVAEATPPRSQRSSQRSNTITTDAYEGPPPRVAFSHSAITSGSQAMKFLKKHKGVVIESVDDKCNILCVRPGTLTKTMKLLESIALGIPIVTDKWLLDSAKIGHFLALLDYQPSVPKQEEEWKFKLDEIWGKPQAPFTGYTIYFTPELRKSYAEFKEIEQVCKTVGAKVTAKKPSINDQPVVLAKEDKDKELEKLMQEGVTCYTKDLLTNSILRGEVDLESTEFMIIPEDGAPTTAAMGTARQTRKKKGRTS